MTTIPASKYDHLVDFICDTPGFFNYLHTTNSIENAALICEQGLRFDTFEKTTDYVCDRDSLAYMINIRKHYGDYTVIIQISKHINNYEAISRKIYDEEDELVYILPPKYIKGYYNRITHELIANPLFEK
jgi:hypothetical protein